MKTIEVILSPNEEWPVIYVERITPQMLKLPCEARVQIPENLADRYETLRKAWYAIQEELTALYNERNKTYISEE